MALAGVVIMDPISSLSLIGLAVMMGYVFYRWPKEPDQSGRRTEWEGHVIEFIPVASHRTLWLATINELWFDGRKVATSGGICFSSTARATVEHDGQSVLLEVQSNKGRSLNLNYQLLINNQLLNSGLARIRFKL